MTDKTADRRTQRTKKLLRQALLELIDEKGLESITVSDLTTRAEINRGTFYLHYKDVYDLLEQMQSEILDGLARLAMEVDFLDIIAHAKRNEPYPGLLSIFEYWDFHADFFKAMLGPKGDPSFAPRVKQMMKDKIYGKVVGVLNASRVSEAGVPLDYILAYMTSANLGVIQHWYDTGKTKTAREMATIMTRLAGLGPIVASGILPGS
ncbi:TetR/AcrR family transcriptional regulator [Cohnella caldifontis]|uniref:TetR/AcrR family transcriptional regulator n=1 Tax=Cohnella caldifontis TaxID=3027471 RepID=UPI0023EB8662|nr:TetR/AcrR family transcriptional regulator [Cohnella sp. YIM B05605]